VAYCCHRRAFLPVLPVIFHQDGAGTAIRQLLGSDLSGQASRALPADQALRHHVLNGISAQGKTVFPKPNVIETLRKTSRITAQRGSDRPGGGAHPNSAARSWREPSSTPSGTDTLRLWRRSLRYAAMLAAWGNTPGTAARAAIAASARPDHRSLAARWCRRSAADVGQGGAAGRTSARYIRAGAGGEQDSPLRSPRAIRDGRQRRPRPRVRTARTAAGRGRRGCCRAGCRVPAS